MQIWLVDSTWIDTKDTAFPLLGVRGGATHNCDDNAALLLLCASEKWKSWPTFFQVDFPLNKLAPVTHSLDPNQTLKLAHPFAWQNKADFKSYL